MEAGATPGTLDLVGYQGDSFSLKVTLQQEDETPVDLTGMDVEFGLAVTRGGKPAFSYSTADYVTISDAVGGEIQILIPEAETRRWNAGRYVYELTVRDHLGFARTFLNGRFKTTREVVR